MTKKKKQIDQKLLLDKLKQEKDLLMKVFGVFIFILLSLCSFILFLNQDTTERDLIFHTNNTAQDNYAVSETITAQILGREDISLELEIADTSQELTQGLMYRESMEKNRGMLFVFNNEQQRSFWMKNTYIPLDIVFLDSDKKIVTIHSNASPLDTSLRYQSTGGAMYAIETNSGWFRDNDVSEGETVEFYLP